MPNISETSVSDISLSPAWSVMIIFFRVDRSSMSGLWARRVSAATGAVAGARSGKWLGEAARPVEDLSTVNDLSREGAAGGR
jgi:hypothetical protein